VAQELEPEQLLSAVTEEDAIDASSTEDKHSYRRCLGADGSSLVHSDRRPVQRPIIMLERTSSTSSLSMPLDREISIRTKPMPIPAATTDGHPGGNSAAAADMLGSVPRRPQHVQQGTLAADRRSMSMMHPAIDKQVRWLRIDR
jgi:hypothetical protein